MKKMYVAFTAFALLMATLPFMGAAQRLRDLASIETLRTAYTDTRLDTVAKDHSQEVSQRAIRNFKREFPQVKNETWSTISKQGFIVSFEENSTRTVVAFNQKGNFQHSIRYYGENEMPEQVRTFVKRMYFDYSIIRVAEVVTSELNTEPIYVVYQESDKELKIVTVCDFEIVNIESLRKVKQG